MTAQEYKTNFLHWLLGRLGEINDNTYDIDHYTVGPPSHYTAPELTENGLEYPNTTVKLEATGGPYSGSLNIQYNRLSLEDLSVNVSIPLVDSTVKLAETLAESTGLPLTEHDFVDMPIELEPETLYQNVVLEASPNSYWVTGFIELTMGISYTPIENRRSLMLVIPAEDIASNYKTKAVTYLSDNTKNKNFWFMGNAKNVTKCVVGNIHPYGTTGFLLHGLFSLQVGGVDYADATEIKIDSAGMVMAVNQQPVFSFLMSNLANVVHYSSGVKWFKHMDGEVTAYNNTGAVVSTFTVPGTILKMAVNRDGKLFIAYESTPGMVIVERFANGVKDAGFASVIITNATTIGIRLITPMLRGGTYLYLDSPTLSPSPSNPIINGEVLVDNQVLASTWNPVLRIEDDGRVNAAFARILNRAPNAYTEGNVGNATVSGVAKENGIDLFLPTRNRLTGHLTSTVIFQDIYGTLRHTTALAAMTSLPVWKTINKVIPQSSGHFSVAGECYPRNATAPDQEAIFVIARYDDMGEVAIITTVPSILAVID